MYVGTYVHTWFDSLSEGIANEVHKEWRVMLDQYGHPSVVGQGAGWGERHRDALHSPTLHTPTQHVRREDTTPVQGNLQTYKPGGEWSGMGHYIKCMYLRMYVLLT